MRVRKKIRMNGPEAQASWYVARLYSGEMTQTEEDDLFSWLKADHSHRRAYDEILALWDAAGELRADLELSVGGSDRALRAITWRKRAGWIAAAAAIVLVVAAPVFLKGLFDRSAGEQALASYQTAIGEQRIVSLADGSRLMLNTGSRVLVDYTANERRIILDFGEVFFEIEKDPQRPLAVVARGRMITVLGTKFSVLLAGNDMRVAVVEGVIAVSREESRFPLAAGQAKPAAGESGTGTPSILEGLLGPDDVIVRAGTMATFSEGIEQVSEEATEAIERVQNWRSGLVRFEGEPLYQVVEELNRYSRTKILIEDNAIVNLPISGIFKLERVDLILHALEDVIPVTVIPYADRYVLVGSDRR